MKTSTSLLACLALGACAVSGNSDESRKDTAVLDFIEVNELESVDSIRTMDQLASREVNDTYVIISTRKQDFLLEYYTRCMQHFDGRVQPDIRQDSRALYPRIDTFRGCRIKAIYLLEPGQADEVREIGRSVGGDR